MQKYVLKRKIARANAGDADGQYELGKAYLNGEDIKQDEKKGKKYLLQSAEQKHAGAQFELGKYYLKTDAEKAENWLGKAANNGSNEAAYLMGIQYFDGKHEPRSLEKAALWYEISAKRGHLPSITMLSDIYNRSNDKSKKLNAKEMLEKAAEQGYAEAQYHLARCYYGKDVKQAVAWLEKSAKGNYYPAYEQLAYFYIAEETYESFKKAVKAFTVAAENGCIIAAYALGDIYYYGKFNVRRDADKAFYWYTKAGSAGITGIGKCYLYGAGVKRNTVKACKILTEEAKYGAVAKYELGNCYFNGWGINQNKDEAQRLWQQSAESGCVDAQKALEKYFA